MPANTNRLSSSKRPPAALATVMRSSHATQLFAPLSPEACAARLKPLLNSEVTTGLPHGIVVRHADPASLKLRIRPRPGSPRRIIPWGLKAKLEPGFQDGLPGTFITGTVEQASHPVLLVFLILLAIAFIIWRLTHSTASASPYQPPNGWRDNWCLILIFIPLLRRNPFQEYNDAAQLFLHRTLDTVERQK